MDELNFTHAIYNHYDGVNTEAARWVLWNYKDKKKPIGIEKFNRKNKSHMWFLCILRSCRIASTYNYFYIDCNWINYLIIRYIKKFKYVRRAHGNDVFLIDPQVFIHEICNFYKDDVSIVEKIYDEYWSK